MEYPQMRTILREATGPGGGGGGDPNKRALFLGITFLYLTFEVLRKRMM
jgi:hypothetical protein